MQNIVFLPSLQPQNVIEIERNIAYGAKAEAYELQRRLLSAIKSEGLADVKGLCAGYGGKLSDWDLDITLLKYGVDYMRQEIVKYLIENCGCRAHITFEVP